MLPTMVRIPKARWFNTWRGDHEVSPLTLTDLLRTNVNFANYCKLLQIGFKNL